MIIEQQIINAQDKYIALIEKSEKSLAVFASTHGVRVPLEDVIEGNRLRKKLEELKSKQARKRRTKDRGDNL